MLSIQSVVIVCVRINKGLQQMYLICLHLIIYQEELTLTNQILLSLTLVLHLKG